MGNDNSSPEHSPNRRTISPTNRKISPIKHQKYNQIPNPIKSKNIKNKSKLTKTLSSPKNIMHFIAQCENAILLKNMNDSNSIGLNHLNILFNPDIINPFLESHLKYVQIIEDSIDKKILGKLKVQNKEFSQKQLESLSNDLIEINNDNSFNNNNNFNLGNLSSIHKKKVSREESPTSQRDDDFDLTSFSTTIGGKASHNISNNKSYGNSKANNSKQVRTFKIRTKDGFSQGDIENNNKNYNYANNKSNASSRNNSNSNNNSYRNNLLRKDSPYSIHSNNSSNNNKNSNILSPINPNKNNFQSKNSSNTSLKLQNNSNQNNNINNNISNKNLNKNKHNPCISDVNSFQTINVTATNNNMNIKNISKKIIKKKLIAPRQILGPKDNIKSPRNNNNIDNSEVQNFSNIKENLSYLDNNNNNQYINNTISDLLPKKVNDVLNKTNILAERNKRSKSPDLILNSKKETGSENSQIIFNNVRPKARYNYNNSNNNSSFMNNLINLSSLSNRKINNTNIIDNDKFIDNYFGQNEPSFLKTEINEENKSYMKGVIKKKKIVNNKVSNPFKKESSDNKKNKMEVKYSKGIKKINNNINKVINKTNNTNSALNNKVLKKEIKNNNNTNKAKVVNENPKINENKKIMKKLNINFNNEKISNKIDSEKDPRNNLNRNKVDTKLILNPKKIEQNKKINNNIVKKNLNQNNIKTNNSFKKKKEQTKKNITLFDDNLENINFLDDEEPEPQNTTTQKDENNINKLINGEKKCTENKFSTKNNNDRKNLNNNNINTPELNDVKKFNTQIKNNNLKSNDEIIPKKNKKRNIKKLKNFKNIVFNIDLSNDNDKDLSKSEDVSDNSISNEEKININNLNEKIKPSLKEKTNIIKKKHINSKKNEFNKIENKPIIYQKENNSIEKKLNKIINKKPKIRKEQNVTNSKINRLIIEKYDNNSENIDDLDDVCNFSGINNVSYTNKQEIEHKNELFGEDLDDDFQRAHSPKPIFHKKINFDSEYKNIRKTKTKDNFNNLDKKEEINDKNHLQNEMNDIDIIDDKIIDDEYDKNNYKKGTKNVINENNLKENSKNNVIKKKDINSNKTSNNIYTSSQGYFSFKIKKENNNKEKVPLIEEKKENDNNKLIKNNESIAESIASSKFNFQINDDIHESEFNDVDFLD